MSEATHRLVQGLVECSFAGEHQIKGKSEPQKVYSLDAIRLNATRFDASVGRGLSTFVGRAAPFVWAPLASLSLAGQEHGRTIPLAD